MLAGRIFTARAGWRFARKSLEVHVGSMQLKRRTGAVSASPTARTPIGPSSKLQLVLGPRALVILAPGNDEDTNRLVRAKILQC